MEATLAILADIISLLTGSITGIATAIGSGLSTLVSSILIQSGGLSTFGAFMFIFMGLSLAIGLSKFVLNWCLNLGK